jgi:hypothetical protein
MADDGDSIDMAKVYIFISMQLFGVIGCCIMLFTALVSPIVHRPATWYNFVFSWIFSGITYTLLLTGGHYFDEGDNVPEFGLCAAQTALIYCSPPM